jgi:hypothetical protein
MLEKLDDSVLPKRPELLPDGVLSWPNDDSSFRFESGEPFELLPERDTLPLPGPLMSLDFPKLLCESEDPDDPDDPLWLPLSLPWSFAIHPPALFGRTVIPRYDPEQCLRCPHEKANSVPATELVDASRRHRYCLPRCKSRR